MSICSFADCEASGNLKTCSACKKVQYCSREHQLADWKFHKSACAQKPSTKFIASDYQTFPKASQHGTVRRTPSSSVKGLATDGMSACVALIFFSPSTGNISLSHTPLRPSKDDLIRHAEWVGPDAILTVVRGSLYADRMFGVRSQFQEVFRFIEKSLRGYASVHLHDDIARNGGVAVLANESKNSPPQIVIGRSSSSRSSSGMIRIGYAPDDHRPGPENIHYSILILNGSFENLTSDLSLFVEFDGDKWTGLPELGHNSSLAVAEMKKAGALSSKFLRKLEWNRDDGLSGANASEGELRQAAMSLQNEVGGYLKLMKKKGRK
jgi:hypothetical protein